MVPIPVGDNQNVSRHCQMSLGGKILEDFVLLVENKRDIFPGTFTTVIRRNGKYTAQVPAPPPPSPMASILNGSHDFEKEVSSAFMAALGLCCFL